MEIAVGVLAATLFFLGVLAGIRASDWLLKVRERRIAEERRALNEQAQRRTDEEADTPRVYLVVDGASNDERDDERDDG